MKKYLINLTKFLYILFCIITTLILSFFLFLTIIGNAIGLKLILYILLILTAIVGFWSLIFIKIKSIIKTSLFISLSIISLYIFLFSSPFSFVYMSICVDEGICKEGFKTKNKDGILFVINKENCINNGYKWYEEDKSCNLRKSK